MKEKLTIRENDSLTIYVKKSKSNEIKENYSLFGWQVVSEAENRSYEDILDITFSRPHKIKNKDELQLLQVYLEDKLNSLAKLERNKTPKTTAFGLFFGVLGIIFSIFGALFAFNLLSGLSTFCSITISCVGIVFLILTLLITPKLYKKEIISFKNKFSELENNIQNICEKANSLFRGENHE